jgi:peroxiredoxin
MAKLENGERLPALSADALDGPRMTLPDDVRGTWSLLAFYRGHW